MKTRVVRLSRVGDSKAVLTQLKEVLELVHNGISNGCAIELITKTKMKEGKVCFPSCTPQGSWKFACYIRVMEITVANIEANKRCARRDVYYQDVGLFQTQRNVDDIIQHICFSMGVTEDALNASAGQKGLVYGDLSISSGSLTVGIDKSMGPVLIPMSVKGKDVAITVDGSVKEIVVIEKEAVFRYMCEKSSGQILISGKGFPDRLTQILVKLLASQNRHIPLYCVVDADVYGLLIYKKYRSECPDVRFRGIRILSGEIHNFQNTNAREHKMLANYIGSSSSTTRREAQRQMWLFRKAELQGCG